jgi:hypothetical protein
MRLRRKMKKERRSRRGVEGRKKWRWKSTMDGHGCLFSIRLL